ncbi:MAG: DUF1571 domain-containing protein [Phycisphaerae bacterium]|nr:DUF1571 domain-containing protein [Phycisphaerae bacterium]
MNLPRGAVPMRILSIALAVCSVCWPGVLRAADEAGAVAPGPAPEATVPAQPPAATEPMKTVSPPATPAPPTTQFPQLDPSLPKTEDEIRRATAKWAQVDWHSLVRTDQLKFLQLLQMKCHETVIDFTATFHKQERIDGKLRDEEAANMKWRRDPFSVYMKFVMGDKGKEAVYVEGQNSGKMRAHAGGLLSWIKLWVEPDSSRAMKDNLRPITKAGMTNMLSAALAVYEEAARNGDLKVEFLGTMTAAGRTCYGIKRTLPKKDIYPGKELVLFIDCEKLVPVGADSYDWDGQIMSKYRYADLKLNTGLTDKDFDWKNPDYGLK